MTRRSQVNSLFNETEDLNFWEKKLLVQSLIIWLISCFFLCCELNHEKILFLIRKHGVGKRIIDVIALAMIVKLLFPKAQTWLSLHCILYISRRLYVNRTYMFLGMCHQKPEQNLFFWMTREWGKKADVNLSDNLLTNRLCCSHYL